MESTYEIRPNHNLFIKWHRGEITVDDEISLLEAVFSDKEFRPGMNAICDFTEASVNWELSDLDRLRAYISRRKETAGDCRWALIFPRGKDKSTARMFIALHEAFEDRITVRLFESSEEGLAWINEKSVPRQE